jgi:hypothetical protein
MKPVRVVALAAAALNASVAAASAQAPAELTNPQIEIEYATPKDADLAPVRERLQSRKVLETFRMFMAPLKLPQKLVVRTDECGGVYVRSRQAGVATLCYEFVAEVRRLAPTGPVQLDQTVYNPARLGPEAAIIGPVVQALLHETVIAALDMLEIPVLGRKDDAADRVAALIMLQFSKEHVAWNTIVGTAWFLGGSALAPVDLADVRGTMAQRYYTMLCIAIGADVKTFRTFVHEWRGGQPAGGDLPYSRAVGCRDEYEVLLNGFRTAVEKEHVDVALLKRVVSMQWIKFFN